MVVSVIEQNFSESSDAFSTMFRSKSNNCNLFLFSLFYLDVFLRRQNDTDLHNRFILLQNQHSSSYEALAMFHNVEYTSMSAPTKKFLSNFDEIAIPNISNQVFKEKPLDK